MLLIFNKLKPFFQDNYRRINVREYARITKISPPTASKTLKELEKNNLLIQEKDRLYINYYANNNNELFIKLSRTYWYQRLEDLLEHIDKQTINPIIIIFGSFSKAEINKNSDIDLAIFTSTDKKINLKEFEKILDRKIQIFQFKKREDIKNKNLLNNILNGEILKGSW